MTAPLALALLLTASTLHAQIYPTKPIQVISPVQAGSAGDISLRLLTRRMSEMIGQQLLV